MLVAQGCEPKCTEVGVVTTDQLMHSLDEDRFANIKLLKNEKLPVKDWSGGGFASNYIFSIEAQYTSATYYILLQLS